MRADGQTDKQTDKHADKPIHYGHANHNASHPYRVTEGEANILNKNFLWSNKVMPKITKSDSTKMAV